ncbi:hypothetical protein FsymDg_3742 [Candidatus Protofrankia datiscae]|uniref:Uncharacterized protein n=1 Tax=Candidatus Protofrankia datiscae TaxID=2716812 RepID=F8B499_9ACTN|nr:MULTISPECIES: YkvA family protein [Protofrankia]AEH11019.1 hypothetical protein FsymDg_3742 [Candidatus Protofrankia datiscae]
MSDWPVGLVIAFGCLIASPIDLIPEFLPVIGPLAVAPALRYAGRRPGTQMGRDTANPVTGTADLTGDIRSHRHDYIASVVGRWAYRSFGGELERCGLFCESGFGRGAGFVGGCGSAGFWAGGAVQWAVGGEPAIVARAGCPPTPPGA